MRYKTSRPKLNKTLTFIVVLAMALLLSGCRTRISNNTEVASTITDDEGWMQELYQERRDELGIPVAKEPFFTGKREDLEDYDDDYDIDRDSFDDDDGDPWDDEFDDVDEDVSSDSSSSSGSTASPNRKTNSTTVKRRTSTTTPKKRTSTTTTKKKTSDTPTETSKKQYTVSFDGNGVDMGSVTITVDQGSKYGSLPAPPAREEFVFDGWYTEKEGGSKVTEDSTYNLSENQTLYAHWTEKDAKEIWNNRFEVAANEQTEKLDCWIPGSDSSALKKMEAVVDSCKGNRVEQTANPRCIIAFVPNDQVTDEEAQRLFDENSGSTEGGSEGGEGGDGGEGSATTTPSALEKVIVISDDAIYGSDSQKLFYKLVLLDAMHGKIGQDTLDAAGSDLGISEYLMAIYIKP